VQNSNAKSSGDVKKIIVITLKLLIIGVVSALLLAVVNELTKDKIDENIEKEKSGAISEIFPGGINITPFLDKIPKDSGVTELNIISTNGDYSGYVAEVAPKGFGGEITLLVGVGTDGKVVGVKVISHSETAGLGSRVGDAEYLSKYVGATGKSIQNVDTISGATISSTAVRDGVKMALSVYDHVTASRGGAK